MKKIILALVMVMAFAVVVPAFAEDTLPLQAEEEGAYFQLWDLAPAGATKDGAKKQAGEINTYGQMGHLLMENKDSNWVIQEDNRWGRMVYFTEENPNNEFVFSGYGLDSENEYSLISYKESDGNGSYVLGTGKTDESGYVQIKGITDTLVLNTYNSGEYDGKTGAKIWLVPSYKLTVDSNGYVTYFNWGAYPSWVLEMLFETELIFVE